MKKYIIAFAFFLCLFATGRAEASTLYSVTPATATTSVSGTSFYGMRFFGINPPNWVVNQVGVYVESFGGSGASATWNLEFRNAAGTLSATSSSKTMSTGWNYFDITPQTLSTYGNDMRIRVQRVSGSGTLNTWRTSTATIAPTLNYREYESSGSADSYPAMQIFGIDIDDPSEGGVNTRIVSQNNPTNGELTPSSVVEFSFDYFMNDTETPNISIAGVDVRDLTSGFEYAPVEEDIIASGLSTYAELYNLTEEHLHMWRPYLRNASSTQIIYGAWYTFDVVDYSSPFEEIPTEYGNATSTVAVGIVGRFLGQQGYLASKFPFAFFYDIASVFGSQNDEAVEGNFPTLTIDMSSSSLPLGSMTLFSSSTISQYAGSTNIQIFRTLMASALWIAFATMVFFGIKHLIR